MISLVLHLLGYIGHGRVSQRDMLRLFILPCTGIMSMPLIRYGFENTDLLPAFGMIPYFKTRKSRIDL